MNDTRSCLVTGGAGFIGSHLVEQLAGAGCKVTVLDTAPLPELNTAVENRPRYVQGSVTDRSLVEQLTVEHDCVFHLAAKLGVNRTMDDPADMIENNMIGTMNVLKSAWRHRKRVVFASSSEVYGKSIPPFHEEADLLYGATTKLRWSYAALKAVEEMLCLGYAKNGLAVSIVRYFNVYGPRQKGGRYGGVIPKFARAALSDGDLTVYGSGSQTRCFTYVADAAAATIAAAGEAAIGEVINIGNGEETSVSELAHMIKTIAGSSSRTVMIPYEQVFRHGFEEIPRRVPDTNKLRTLLRFEPRIDLVHGLSKTINWHRNEDAGTPGGGEA